MTFQPTAESPRYEGSISTLNTKPIQMKREKNEGRTNEHQTGRRFPSNSESVNTGNPELLQTVTKHCEQIMFAYLRAPPGGWISTPCRAIIQTLFFFQLVDMMAQRHPRTEVSNPSLEQGCIPVITEVKRWSSHSADG